MRAGATLLVVSVAASLQIESAAFAQDAEPKCDGALDWRCFDLDKNGRLDDKEAHAYALHRVSQFFRDVDKNRDGVVDAAELKAYESDPTLRGMVADLTERSAIASPQARAKALDDYDATQRALDAEAAPIDLGALHLLRSLADFGADADQSESRGASVEFTRDFRQIRENRSLADDKKVDPNSWSAEGVLLYDWFEGRPDQPKASRRNLSDADGLAPKPTDHLISFVRFERHTSPQDCEERNLLAPGIGFEWGFTDMPIVPTQFVRANAEFQTDSAFDRKAPLATFEWEPVCTPIGLGVPTRIGSLLKYTGRAYVQGALGRVSNPGDHADAGETRGSFSWFGPTLALTVWPTALSDKLKLDLGYEHRQAIRGDPRTSDLFTATLSFALSKNTSFDLDYQHGAKPLFCTSKDSLDVSLGIKF